MFDTKQLLQGGDCKAKLVYNIGREFVIIARLEGLRGKFVLFVLKYTCA